MLVLIVRSPVPGSSAPHPPGLAWPLLALPGRRYGFTRHDVIAFGDSYNDVDMLEWAGLGVAMADAPEAVRQAADVVCGSVNEDGVARFLSPVGYR